MFLMIIYSSADSSVPGAMFVHTSFACQAQDGCTHYCLNEVNHYSVMFLVRHNSCVLDAYPEVVGTCIFEGRLDLV